MTKVPQKRVTVILPLDLYDFIKQLADGSCRTPSMYIRQIIKSYVRQREDCPAQLQGWPNLKMTMPPDL